jgi:glutamine cyclotransferase
MRFGEVIQALMAGGGNAVWRGEWGGATFLRYSELWNIFELHGPGGRVTQLEELSLSPGDLFANDWAVVKLDPRTGEVAK